MKRLYLSDVTEEQKQLVVSLYTRGVPNKQIIEIAQVTDKILYHILREQNIPTKAELYRQKREELKQEELKQEETEQETTQINPTDKEIAEKLDKIIEVLQELLEMLR